MIKSPSPKSGRPRNEVRDPDGNPVAFLGSYERKNRKGNSSKPPSSDIVKPPKPKGRGKKKRQRGGQKGHIREICFLAEHSDAVLSRWGKKMLGWTKQPYPTLLC